MLLRLLPDIENPYKQISLAGLLSIQVIDNYWRIFKIALKKFIFKAIFPYKNQ